MACTFSPGHPKNKRQSMLFFQPAASPWQPEATMKFMSLSVDCAHRIADGATPLGLLRSPAPGPSPKTRLPWMISCRSIAT